MSRSRERILARLRSRPGRMPPRPVSDFSVLSARGCPPEQRLDRFQAMIESVHGEVHRVAREGWVRELDRLLRQKGIGNLLAPRTHPIGAELRAAWSGDGAKLLAYEQPIEQWRPQLFGSVEAALTSTVGAIAETGSLILWPTPDQPRLMSLVPPVHIAVLDADRIHGTFYQALTAGRWADGMPTNALLISGPSKTADIEQTLAYGVHGPKELVVLVRR